MAGEMYYVKLFSCGYRTGIHVGRALNDNVALSSKAWWATHQCTVSLQIRSPRDEPQQALEGLDEGAGLHTEHLQVMTQQSLQACQRPSLRPAAVSTTTRAHIQTSLAQHTDGIPQEICSILMGGLVTGIRLNIIVVFPN